MDQAHLQAITTASRALTFPDGSPTAFAIAIYLDDMNQQLNSLPDDIVAIKSELSKVLADIAQLKAVLAHMTSVRR